MDQASPQVNPILRMMQEPREGLAAEIRLAGLYGRVKMDRAKGNPVERDRALASWTAAVTQCAEALALQVLAHPKVTAP